MDWWCRSERRQAETMKARLVDRNSRSLYRRPITIPRLNRNGERLHSVGFLDSPIQVPKILHDGNYGIRFPIHRIGHISTICLKYGLTCRTSHNHPTCRHEFTHTVDIEFRRPGRKIGRRPGLSVPTRPIAGQDPGHAIAPCSSAKTPAGTDLPARRRAPTTREPPPWQLYLRGEPRD